MKVLMFGWEFPPHISGGLGTTCYGLSRALLKTETQLLFVVPKSYGGEAVPLVDASGVAFINPSEALSVLPLVPPVYAAETTSWADRDLSARLGNDMQKDAFRSLKKLHIQSKQCGRKILEDLRYLQTSDHFYYMSTKKDGDGKIHQYFRPFRSPYEAFMNYINILSDIEYRIQQADSGNRLVHRLEETLSLV